jgi:hypothetical protein
MVMREAQPVQRRRQASWRQGKSEELPWVVRSRMAMSAASIADAARASGEI